jgi:hypothetical protein
MRNVVLAAITLMAVAAPAHAQMQWRDRGFVNVNFLGQPASRDVTATGSFDLYDEVATFEAPREIGGGFVFDLSGGVKVWRNLAVGLGYSRFSNTSPATVTASIPDPFVTDSPHVQTLDAGELEHSENAFHISAVWFWPVTDKIDVAVSAGPSFFNVDDESVVISEANVAPGTPTVTGVDRVSDSETGVGINLGVDVTYLVTPRIGAGVLLRYAGASVDLPGIDGLDVGGFHLGAGIRVRF